MVTFSNGVHAALVAVDPRWVRSGSSDTSSRTTAAGSSTRASSRARSSEASSRASAAPSPRSLSIRRRPAPNGPFMDYRLPRATDLPDIAVDHLETLSTRNPLGLKRRRRGRHDRAVPAAIAAAIEDALRDYGVTVTTVPLTPSGLSTSSHRPPRPPLAHPSGTSSMPVPDRVRTSPGAGAGCHRHVPGRAASSTASACSRCWRDCPCLIPIQLMSPAARQTIALETDRTPRSVEALAHTTYRHADIAAALSSGSFRTKAICNRHPVLDEDRGRDRLGLRRQPADAGGRRDAEGASHPRRFCPRETPLHLGHLRTLAQLAEIGAVVAPLMPGFYGRPTTLDQVTRPPGGPTARPRGHRPRRGQGLPLARWSRGRDRADSSTNCSHQLNRGD